MARALRAGEILYPVKKLVRMSTDTAERIAAYRAAHQLPSENEAIRQLLELGLEQAERTSVTGDA